MTSILLTDRISSRQESYYSNMSFLFGNLPIQLPVKQIIDAVKNSKTFESIENSENNYKGKIAKSKFFKLKPSKTLIEIAVKNKEDQAGNSFIEYDYLSLQAYFKKYDLESVAAEYKRIIKLFTPDFEKGKIENESEKVTFYKSASDTIPTLIIILNTIEIKYIKLIYFKK